MTDNELIAEFRGWSSFKTEHDTFWHSTEKCTASLWEYHSLHLDSFQKSWDWLIPVWIKFRDLPSNKKHKEKNLSLAVKLASASKPLDFFTHIVEAIKWYNENKKP
jgi:hypothetical protein